MCLLQLVPAEPARRLAHPTPLRLGCVAAATLLAALLLPANAAQAGQCNAMKQSPALIGDRGAVTEPALSEDPQLPPSALDDTPAPTAADLTVATVGRPTGPEVQPCRHLPAEQKLECLRRTAGVASSPR